MIEALTFLAGGLEVARIILLGRKIIGGWVCGMAADVVWLQYVLLSGNAYGLLIICLPALYLNYRSYRKWRAG